MLKNFDYSVGFLNSTTNINLMGILNTQLTLCDLRIQVITTAIMQTNDKLQDNIELCLAYLYLITYSCLVLVGCINT